MFIYIYSYFKFENQNISKTYRYDDAN